MVDFSVLIAWVTTLGIPVMILGYGSMINEFKATTILAYINFIVLMGYNMHKGYISDIFLYLVTIILALLTWFSYKSALRGDS